jgi:hypothetical protein
VWERIEADEWREGREVVRKEVRIAEKRGDCKRWRRRGRQRILFLIS